MRYECPCCKVRWQNPTPPEDQPCEAVCAFCVANPSAAALLTYQMENLELIPLEHYPKIMRAVYRQMRDLLEEKVNSYANKRALE